jgi:hypothetical protein
MALLEITTCFEKNPCLTALLRTVALPRALRGPVDFWAFRRFVSALRADGYIGA